MSALPSPEPEARPDLRVVLLVWAAISALLVIRALLGLSTVPLIADTDDAMRLVVVRDWLAGQDWYDNVQHRLNTPYGAELHWSRLADLPVAGLILLLRPVFGAGAEMLAAWILPLLLLLVLLWLCARLTLRLVGRTGLLPALVLPMLAPALVAEFSPGRIDHHSLQILLTLVVVWCTIEALERPRFALAAGLAAATALAIGTEAVPMVAATILAFGLIWVSRPERADALLGFGLSFGLTAAALLGLTVPSARWLVAACDAHSITYAAVALGTGLAFALLAVLPLARRPSLVRLGAGAAAGAILIAAIVVLFPQCLSGPYAALDPWLVENWLARIIEARPLWHSIAAMPPLSIALALPPLVALVVVGVVLRDASRPDRLAWLVLGLHLAVAVAVMVVQVRGARIAAPLAIPAAALLIAAARTRYLATRRPGAIAGLAGAWLVSAGAAVLLIVALATSAFDRVAPGEGLAEADRSARLACLMPDAFVDLAGLPPERIMAPIDLGAHLLLFSPHAVVAAPYHRNQAGVRDAFAFFNGPAGAARNILLARGVGLVVVCPGMAELRGVGEVAPDALIRELADGRVPPWLDEVTLSGAALRVFAVEPRGP